MLALSVNCTITKAGVGSSSARHALLDEECGPLRKASERRMHDRTSLVFGVGSQARTGMMAL
jgi:hypothetical protein